MRQINVLLTVAVGLCAAIALAVHWYGDGAAAPLDAVAPAAPRSMPMQALGGRDGAPSPLDLPSLPQAAVSDAAVPTPNGRRERDLLNELSTIQVPAAGDSSAARGRVLALLSELVRQGPVVLPALRTFLATGRDVAYPAPSVVNPRRDVAAVPPPSLRIGLFDVVRQIGGPGAERILAETANGATRVAELAALDRMLDELAPGMYRDVTVMAVKRLLTSGAPVERADHDALYAMLAKHGDTTFVDTAKSLLVRADGTVDGSALQYLKQAIGEQSLELAAGIYGDARVTDPASKTQLARVALAYVGANDQALDLYRRATQDPALTPQQRKDLVEDLNVEGLSDSRNPTRADLAIVSRRYAIAQAYLQQEYVKRDKVLDEAFREAAKDLAALLRRAGVLPGVIPPGN